MLDTWRENILRNLKLARDNSGPALVAVVSGNERDRDYWQEHFASFSRDLFNAGGDTGIMSIAETTRKGNFLGTLNAWATMRRASGKGENELPAVALISMVFGRGTRLSPFTQALGNRKPAFPIPMRSRWTDGYLCTADLSNLYTNLWVNHLQENGFRGVIVKWGDEAIIPGKQWDKERPDLRQVDAIRFVWHRDITEDLAREKEWVAIESQTGLVKHQYARQGFDSLKAQLSQLEEGKYEVGVNLGSLAVSYEFLSAALDVFNDDIWDSQKWIDWDPYVWMALHCRDESQWRAEVEHEARIGKTGIRDLETRFPNFYARMSELRSALEAKTKRPFSVGVLEFGEPFWADFGLHLSLRRLLESVTADSDRGSVSRDLFGIPQARDKNGNIIVRSTIPLSVDIQHSVIIDTMIQDEETVIRNGLLVGGHHKRVHMPHGGSALFCLVDDLALTGPHGIAFRSVGSKVVVPAGGRHTTLLLSDELLDMVTDESVVDYSGDNYSRPILGNRLSFEEAEKIMLSVDAHDLERRWWGLWQAAAQQ